MIWLYFPLAYLAGSIPFGVLIARFLGPTDPATGRPVDLRSRGSGNIGATNVWRVLGWRLGLLCFVLDVLKGLVPTFAAGLALDTLNNPAPPTPSLLAWLGVAICCILGHLYPVWLGFKGGKGVATSLGALAGVFPVLTIAVAGAAVVWCISARLTRMVGISSCVAALALPLLVWAQSLLPPSWRSPAGPTGLEHPAVQTPVIWPYLAATIPLALLVIYKHRANIARTIAGTENRIGGAKPAA